MIGSATQECWCPWMLYKLSAAPTIRNRPRSATSALVPGQTLIHWGDPSTSGPPCGSLLALSQGSIICVPPERSQVSFRYHVYSDPDNAKQSGVAVDLCFLARRIINFVLCNYRANLVGPGVASGGSSSCGTSSVR